MKVRRIQHNQTSFTTNAKGISPVRKHERRKRFTENKSRTIKKTVTRSHILIKLTKIKDRDKILKATRGK